MASVNEVPVIEAQDEKRTHSEPPFKKHLPYYEVVQLFAAPA